MIKSFELQEEELKLEIFNLKMMNQEMQQFKDPFKEKTKEDKPVEEVADSEKFYSKMIDDLKDSQTAIYELDNEQNLKKEIIKNMETLLKNILQNSKTDQGIQVDEGDLQWTPDNMISRYLPHPLPKPTKVDNGSTQVER